MRHNVERDLYMHLQTHLQSVKERNLVLARRVRAEWDGAVQCRGRLDVSTMKQVEA